MSLRLFRYLVFGVVEPDLEWRWVGLASLIVRVFTWDIQSGVYIMSCFCELFRLQNKVHRWKWTRSMFQLRRKSCEATSPILEEAPMFSSRSGVLMCSRGCFTITCNSHLNRHESPHILQKELCLLRLLTHFTPSNAPAIPPIPHHL